MVACDFSNTNFQKSHIQGSQLLENKFNNCHLQETDFSTSHIKACDFSNANLTGVHFKTGVLEKCITKDAVWKRTSFIAMHLSEITFDGRIEDCYFDNSTFRKVIFCEATLINTFFKGKSLKRLQFIDCSADRMTYEFLKNGKADVSGGSCSKNDDITETGCTFEIVLEPICSFYPKAVPTAPFPVRVLRDGQMTSHTEYTFNWSSDPTFGGSAISVTYENLPLTVEVTEISTGCKAEAVIEPDYWD